MGEPDLRNCVRVVYGSPRPTPVPREPEKWWERIGAIFGRRYTHTAIRRPEVEAREDAAVTRYGERVAVINTTEDEGIRTEREALELATSILRDFMARRATGEPEQ